MAENSTGARSALTLVVSGRVAQVTQRAGQNGATFFTLLKTPAVDEFSSPGTFEIRSKRRLGSEGATIEVQCDVLGFSRSYERKADGETVKTAEIVLQASA